MVFDWSVLNAYTPDFLRGLLLTIGFSFLVMPISFVMGAILALCAISPFKVLRYPIIVFVEVFRNVPFLILVFMVYFGLPSLRISLSPTVAAIISLSILGTTLFTETIRGAILSVPRGQLESARAIGMSYWLAMRRIVFPQMLAYLLPPTGNHLIAIVKNTSILSVITIAELTLTAQRVTNITYSPVEVYTIISLMYWALNALIEAGITHAQRKLQWRPNSGLQPHTEPA